MAETGQPIGLSDLIRGVGRSWRVLVSGALAGALIGLSAHLALPQTFSATASLRVEATGLDPLAEPTPHQVDMATEETVASSRQISGSRKVDVEAVGQSSILRITHTSATPRGAARGANAVARAYLVDRAQRAARSVAEARAVLKGQVEALPPRSSAPQAQQLATDLALSRRLRTGGGRIIDVASPPERGDLPGPALSCLAAGLLGLLLATPLAALRSRPDATATQVVLLDVDPAAQIELRQGAAALADHVLVLRDDADLDPAERWCEHLRSVGIPADVVRVGDPMRISRTAAGRAS
ncbi:hypothetical protein [Aeromicrobium sp.]|uniref:hypothetical protein n=1 Tax=Aeromicrobium sp. TaxID=1871063 RepID=UPI0030C0E6AB